MKDFLGIDIVANTWLLKTTKIVSSPCFSIVYVISVGDGYFTTLSFPCRRSRITGDIHYGMNSKEGKSTNTDIVAYLDEKLVPKRVKELLSENIDRIMTNIKRLDK
ncbi:hypothetical protein N9137_00830 [Pseudomonadales bacterium]|nr:hypothetical protein [Pseudomonadales bacterium]